MSHRDLQEDIGLELPFAGIMIAELLEWIGGSDRCTIATRSQLGHTPWRITTSSRLGRWFELVQGDNIDCLLAIVSTANRQSAPTRT
jgi:hypothetical protein